MFVLALNNTTVDVVNNPKIAGPLMEIVVTTAKNILAPLGITAAASAIDAGIQKKIHGSGTTTLIIPNEEMFIKIILLMKILY